jgi:hypothetical protein
VVVLAVRAVHVAVRAVIVRRGVIVGMRMTVIMVVIMALGRMGMPVIVIRVIVARMVVALVGLRSMAVVRMIVRVMGMIVVGMIVMGVIVVIVAALAVVVGRALGLEGTGHRAGGAALAADEFGGAAGHVEHVGGDLGGHVAAAELPGEAEQPGRVLGADLEERFPGGADRDEATVLQAQGIAVLQGRGLGQGEGQAQAALPRQALRRGLPGGMVENDRVDDRIGTDGDLADDGGGALHGFLAAERAAGAAPMGPDGRITRRFFGETERRMGTLTVRRAFPGRNA